MKRKYYAGVAFLAVLGALAIGSMPAPEEGVVEAAGVQAPRFEVDPMWPKPLPNHWVIGATIGVAVDANDQSGSFIAQARSKPRNSTRPGIRRLRECCAAAPPVLEFNEAGDLIGHWGGPGEGYDWPASNHGIDVDYKGNVWIGGNGRGQQPAGRCAAHDESRMGARSRFTTAWS